MQLLFDPDLDFSLIRTRQVAIIGYGNQGRAQALNLRDSGVAVTIALPPASPRRSEAEAAGFEVLEAAAAAARADLVMMLAPDEAQAEIYDQCLAAHLKTGAALAFSHGLAIAFDLVRPRADLDVILVAPKGPGTALRSEYEAGRGLLTLFAVAQDATGKAEHLALAYAGAIGGGRAGLLRTRFDEECQADLFNEAAVLWGAVPELILAGFETLTEAGFSPEIAYLECLTEVKLLADLVHARGIAGMREAISNTAEFGALSGGRRIVTDETRAEMRRMLAEIRRGDLVRELMDDRRQGYERLERSRRLARAHPIEAVGRALRTVRPESSQTKA